MKIGVLVESFRKNIRQGIAKAKEVGAEGIQIYAVGGETAPWNLSSKDRKELLDLVRSHGMEISALCGDFGGYGFTNPEENPSRIEKSKQIMDLALDLDCRVVTTHIGVIPPDKSHPRWAIMQEACEILGEYGEQVGATFAIETGPETAAVLRGFLDSLSSKGVGVNLDPANLVMVTGDDPVEAVHLLKDYIVHTHAKDGRLLKKAQPEIFFPTYGSPIETVEDDSEYCIETPLGEGEINFYKYIKALDHVGFTGYLTIEREVGDNPEADIKMAVNFLNHILKELNLKG